MFQVRSDPAKNRLYITLAGYLDETEQKEAASALLEEAENLVPGFDLVSDISKLRPTNDEGLRRLSEVQTFLKHFGVRRVIRVTGIVLSELQMERTAQRLGWAPLTAPTLEEADRILDGLLGS